MEEEVNLQEQRDIAFKKWLQVKSIQDKAIELLTKLDNARATETDSLKEVAIAICAADLLVQSSDPSKNTNTTTQTGIGNHDSDEEGSTTSKVPKKNGEQKNKKGLRAYWVKWAMGKHTFTLVKLSEADVKPLSGAAMDFIEKMDGYYMLPSLKYFFPAAPKKPGDKPPALTNDQKIQNLLFMRNLKNMWNEAEHELYRRINKYISQKSSGSESQPKVTKEAKDFEQKESGSKSIGDLMRKAEGKSEVAVGSAKNLLNSFDLSSSTRESRWILQCLQDFSLKAMKLWVEEDEDKNQQRQREEDKERRDEAKIAHDQWLKKKDSLRIRLPTSDQWKKHDVEGPPMSYGRELGAVKSQEGPAKQALLKAMADSGLKYIHALGHGMQGHEGDYEKTKRQLLEKGHVIKENFRDEEDPGAFISAIRSNKVLQETKKMKSQNEKLRQAAFEEWVSLKDMKDQALKCLEVLEVPGRKDATTASSTSVQGGSAPQSMFPNGKNPLTSSVNLRGSLSSLVSASSSAAMSTSSTTPMSMKYKSLSPVEMTFVLDVGRALKKIDRSLVSNYAHWVKEVFSFQTVTVLWDFFEPRACDIHSSAYSAVRDAFSKVLRPGVDYRKVFLDFANRVYRRQEALAQDQGRQAESKEEVMQSLSLSKADMEKLLIQLGVSLKSSELKVLVDALDSDGNGEVSLQEFLNFVGPFREKKAAILPLASSTDASGTANSASSTAGVCRCCWRTTCTITGMPNAYSFSSLDLKLPAHRKLLRSFQARLESQEKDSKDRKGGSGSNRGSGWGQEKAERKEISSRSQGGSKSVESKNEDEDEDNDKSKESSCQLQQLSNGEYRLIVELKERQKRIEILKSLGLLHPKSKKSNHSTAAFQSESKGERDPKNRNKKEDPGRGDDGDGNYDDDFVDHETSKDYQDDFDAIEDPEKSSQGKDQKSKKDSCCSYSQWTVANRAKGMEWLLQASQGGREEKALTDLLAQGKPPQLPEFWVEIPLEENRNPSNQNSQVGCSVILHWSPSTRNPQDLISFFSVEFGGRAGQSSTPIYREVYRDPPVASWETQFALSYEMGGMRPGTSYLFRVRALNGFGAGEFVYKTFTTRPEAPLTPQIIKLSWESVTLQWVFPPSYYRRLEELRKIFELADADHSGEIDREELVAILEDKALESSELHAFLQKAGRSLGVDVSQSYAAIFDQIEGDDDNKLSWNEFQDFFKEHGWTTFQVSSSANPASATSASSQLLTSSTTSLSGSFATSSSLSSPLTYVIEQCLSDLDQTYQPVARTTSTQYALHRLSSNTSYRFRIVAYNVDQIPSPPSPSCIVHTFLENPPPPLPYPCSSISTINSHGTNASTTLTTTTTTTSMGLSRGNILSLHPTSLGLSWKSPPTLANFSRHPDRIEQMVGEWSQGLGSLPGATSSKRGDLEGGGVSVQAAFARFDVNGDGVLSTSELETMFQVLGVEIRPERLHFALEFLDTNGDGLISFPEFQAFWKSREVTFTLKRSQEIPPLAPLGSNTSMGATLGGSGSSSNSNTNSNTNSNSSSSMSVANPTLATGKSRPNSSHGSRRDPSPSPTPTPLRASLGEKVHGDPTSYASVGRSVSQASVPPRPRSATPKIRSSNSNSNSGSQLHGSVSGTSTLLPGSRSPSPGNLGNTASMASPAGGAGSGMVVSRQAAVPIVCYQGQSTRSEILGLKANALYHFRLRWVGSRSHSLLSPPLRVMTTPFPPSSPVLVEVTSNSARLKWYPPEEGGGAWKFWLQGRGVPAGVSSGAEGDGWGSTGDGSWPNILHCDEVPWSTLALPSAVVATTSLAVSSSNTSSSKAPPTWISETFPTNTSPPSWVPLYQGQDTIFQAINLPSKRSFQVRVFAINCQGAFSLPSPVLTFSTLDRPVSQISSTGGVSGGGGGINNTSATTPSMSIPRNLASKFPLECTGDLCLGDTILFTERLYARESSSQTTQGPLQASSQTSTVLGQGLGRYLGERTIAAIILRDNFKTLRAMKSATMSSASSLNGNQLKNWVKHRRLWMEVIWQVTTPTAGGTGFPVTASMNSFAPNASTTSHGSTSSRTKTGESLDLKPGQVIQRAQTQLEEFEVFRSAWKHEKARKSWVEECLALSECYLPADF